MKRLAASLRLFRAAILDDAARDTRSTVAAQFASARFDQRDATRRIVAETRRRDACIWAAERVDGARVSPHARRGASGGCAIECRRNRAAGRAHVTPCSPFPLSGSGGFYD